MLLKRMVCAAAFVAVFMSVGCCSWAERYSNSCRAPYAGYPAYQPYQPAQACVPCCPAPANYQPAPAGSWAAPRPANPCCP